MKNSHRRDKKRKRGITADEMVLKYGTYEIQSTADTDNEFPKIAQGLARKDTNNPKHRQQG